ncbi:hypothetical protein D9758_017515 [Tetrapyrgos nigripes]|uniref:YTH domain-containing protein n=1 Tax=Tetrapyrgos nigripes TaxID=182062 RepID=A0A8H5FEE4_9AGAR|nr:hypothetical protein D9758_017515 [Tetrapyrgos nigripes]
MTMPVQYLCPVTMDGRFAKMVRVVPTMLPQPQACSQDIFQKRYFILKTLSQCDLDLSVQKGLWATQKYNEGILDQAYRTCKEVYLIFSVNKSGEFYGYARMAGPVSYIDESTPEVPDSPSRVESPWQPVSGLELVGEQRDEDAGGRSFKVEWLCTKRLPFYKTRHFRNPWNHDREVKVSRDGTALEPSVGQQLIDEWTQIAIESQSQQQPETTAATAVSSATSPSTALIEGNPTLASERTSTNQPSVFTVSSAKGSHDIRNV